MVSDTFDFLKATPVFSQMEAGSHQPMCHMMRFLFTKVNHVYVFGDLSLSEGDLLGTQTELLLSKPCLVTVVPVKQVPDKPKIRADP